MRARPGFATALLFSGLPTACWAATSAAQIPRVSHAPELSYFVSRVGPSPDVLRIDDFRQRQPHDGQPATRPTTAYLFYTDSALHVVFVCSEDPAAVRAHLGRRESITGDDIVGVSIDTFHDGRRAYMFYANPLGVQLDGISTEGQPDDYKFDTVWSSEGKLTESGYVVRFAIPFKSIRSRAGEGRSWGLALTRSIPRNNEYAMWPRITDKIEAFVPQFAEVNAPAVAGAAHDILLNPYAFAAEQRYLPADSALLRSQRELRAGMDAKIVARNGLTLDVTANPDFSQVESDEPQVTVNRRYEVYFPEKRPFFLDNAGFFQTPETLFFSRRIVDPEFGARLTGKLGPWTVGVLAVDDRASIGNGESDGRATIGVVRVQREMGKESSIGVLLTSRQTGAETNTVGAVDLRWKVNPNWVVTAQAAKSSQSGREVDATGEDIFTDVRYVGRHLTYSTSFRDRTPGFVADLGFITRTDIRQTTTDLSYRWRPEAGLVTSLGPSVYSTVTYDHSGILQDWSIETPFTLNLRGPSTVSVTHTAAAEVFGRQTFRRDANRLVLSTDRWKSFGLTASVARGRAINYHPAAGLQPFGADGTDASFEMTLHASPRVRIDETYLYSRLGVHGQQILDEHIARSKLAVQFTRAASLRTILDYNGSLANERLIDLSKTKRLGFDILFTYLLHPGTALYVGYNQRRENWMWPDGVTGAPIRGGPPSFQSGRQVFVKLSYLFRI